MRAAVRASTAFLFSALPAWDPAGLPPLVLVDGSAFVFRNYYARQGLENAGVVGFCRSLLGLLVPLPPDAPLGAGPPQVVVAFDSGTPSFRKDIDSSYKAQRTAPPDDLIPQFHLAQEACRAFSWTVLSAPSFEADDIIATCARGAEAHRPVVIVGADKDFLQLVSDQVLVYDPNKKTVVTAVDVEARFGVRPDQMIDFQALMGDSTDGVPGVPGIGPKTAAELLKRFGTMDSVLEKAENPENIPQPKRRENLLNFRGDRARTTRDLVTLKCDVPASKFDPPLSEADFSALLRSPVPFAPRQPALEFCEAHLPEHRAVADTVRRVWGRQEEAASSTPGW
uniref:5'-3' exonuclease domain-containing protein n=1 Tax=Rhizochromulina marina TaxID=1034831 RepID=A0A7S2RH59_9STRA|mmetsp:Transcript_16287/g.47776  ORF Transcript_16287/g.47776 Transcript_16287/m.47776 type:complete len:339 (+) Transcript_16287:41-1057(+)